MNRRMVRWAVVAVVLGAVQSGQVPALADSAPVRMPGTSHWYQVVDTPMPWEQARRHAKTLTVNGMPGHLVTITSAAESDFVFSISSAWSDLWSAGAEVGPGAGYARNWAWVDGPEAGQLFTRCTQPVGAESCAPTGAFTRWPDFYGQHDNYEDTHQRVLSLNWYVYGNVWDDQNGSEAHAFVVEFEPASPTLNRHRSIDTNWGNICSASVAGTVLCWGHDGFQVGVAQVPADLPPALDVEVGTAHACALTLDHEVRCWGVQGHGGWPAHGQSEVPADLGPAVQISVGAYHSCALLMSGAVRCWGIDADHGSGLPVASVPSDLGEVSRVEAGGMATCALLQTGAVRCWGSGTTVADAWQGRSDFTAVSISGRGANAVLCAVTTAHKVECLGTPQYQTGQEQVPADLGPAVDVSAGSFETCALLMDASVRCWGWSLSAATTVPAGLDSALSVTTDAGTACVVTKRETVTCWGSPYAAPAEVQAPSPPAPTAVSAQALDGAAGVAWSPVEVGSDGQPTVYQVVSAPGGFACTTTELSCTVTGLANREHYTFTVTAANAAGASEASAPSNEVMPLAPGLQAWPGEQVLALGSATSLTIAQAAPNASVSVTGALKAAVSADSAGFATAVFTPAKAGVHKVTASYLVKVGKKTTKYSTTAQVYVPSVVPPAMRVKAARPAQFRLTYCPPGSSVAVVLTDGSIATGQADAAGRATLSVVLSAVPSSTVDYRVLVAGTLVRSGSVSVGR